MTNDVNLDLVGDKELLKIISALEVKTQHKVLKKVVSDAANVYVKEAKSVIPRRTTKLYPPPVRPGRTRGSWHPPGTGKKSPMKKVGKSKKSATYFVGPRTGTGDRRTDAWYLKFWEHGSSKMTGAHKLIAAYKRKTEKATDVMFKSMRKIMEREIKKYAKR